MVLQKGEIEKQAKEILDKFASALDKAGISDGETYVDREEFERREENNDIVCGDDFKKRVLDNAPESDQNHIITERGSWK